MRPGACMLGSFDFVRVARPGQLRCQLPKENGQLSRHTKHLREDIDGEETVSRWDGGQYEQNVEEKRRIRRIRRGGGGEFLSLTEMLNRVRGSGRMTRPGE